MDFSLNLAMYRIIHCKCCLLKSQNFSLDIGDFVLNFLSDPVSDGVCYCFCVFAEFPVCVGVLDLKTMC